ncbi:DivIVA domain-containing protein [Micromonospora sp. HM5-17]|jgi:DivIVA domain-containing protein|uniref:DivIVA domain-containing protein n=1 Tax=Micromonospora sp. HM5-17 TaxID=2487710 RepID=UPI000F48CBF2|nr:DivIVA domain-containing protein [Micromonospora sp. HM5-17]ROT31797.1 DivIVA domain-containing protein [Micromonospora sp. HM5-17]
MIYRTGQRIRPYQIRAKTFGHRRRGLDPDEVYAYLHQVADELDRVLREESIAHTEAERIRQGLRQWQTRHARCHLNEPERRPAPPRSPNRGPW